MPWVESIVYGVVQIKVRCSSGEDPCGVEDYVVWPKTATSGDETSALGKKDQSRKLPLFPIWSHMLLWTLPFSRRKVPKPKKTRSFMRD